MKHTQDYLKQPCFPPKCPMGYKEVEPMLSLQSQHTAQGHWATDHVLTWAQIPRHRGQEDAETGSPEVGVSPKKASPSLPCNLGQASPPASISSSEI